MGSIAASFVSTPVWPSGVPANVGVLGFTSPSGATVMIDPAHPDFPPTWLTRHYGALCVGYPGVEAKTFAPGESFTLNYRVNLHDASAELVDLGRA